MDTVEIEIDEDGRIVGPVGVKIRIPLAPDQKSLDVERRRERLAALFKEIDERLDDVPRKPWPKDDPIVEKFRRKGLLDESA